MVERGGDLVVERHRLDLETGRNVVERTIVRDGHVRTVPSFVRLFTFPEVRDLMLAAGFTSVHAFGAEGGPLTIDSRRMIVVAGR
ncbi:MULTISPECIES: hypothetical protein [Nonomuraea]|uniref:Class I SAM-dependent methyltransferase n=1 Tax=Nonomuraea salmonea TaxID=46181 RepID=A0ABV5NRD1_9ACTN